MRRPHAALMAGLVLFTPAVAAAQYAKAPEKAAVHFPGPVWPHKTPAEVLAAIDKP